MEERDGLPVSVVIPVKDEAAGLERCLSSLLGQRHAEAAGRLEVIVVDNGSSDATVEVARSFGTQVLFEHSARTSPYSARNRGIEHASGDIIALLDANCRPAEHWLSAALEAMQSENLDLASSNVVFDVGSSFPASHVYDALVHTRVKDAVYERGCAMTASLFVKKHVFDELGLFREGVRSGEDLRWTKAATESGYRLGFVPQSQVRKRPRSFWALTAKECRVRRGKVILDDARLSFGEVGRRLRAALKPPQLHELKPRLRNSPYPNTRTMLFRLWLIRWWL